MQINCEKAVEKYLLIQNPLYAFSFPIAILMAIIFFGIAKAYKWSDNSYINQILIPVLALLLTMVILDMVSRLMISKSEKMHYVDKCTAWKNRKYVERFTSHQKQHHEQSKDDRQEDRQEDMQDDKQDDKQEQFQQHHKPPSYEQNEVIIKNDDVAVEIPIATIPNFSPSELKYNKEKTECIENSSCCSLCSGTNSNPCNLIAPIPGPQWLPLSAESVQNRLKNNNYTKNRC